MLKKIISSLLFLFLCCGVLKVSAQESKEYNSYDADLWIDNQMVDSEYEYLIKDDCMLVPIHIVEQLGASYEWKPEEWRIRIQSENRKLTMYMANNQCANGVKLERMPVKPTLHNGVVMVPLRYVAEALGTVVFWNCSTNSVLVSTTGEIPEDFYDTEPESEVDELLKNKIIVLDPGHGGSDPGAVARNVKEKDLNLKVSKILFDMLENAGAKVYMTRTEDKYVGLYTRADIANNLNANLFVSVHHNASSDSGAKGVMTLYYPTSNKRKMNGQKFAQIVQKNLVSDLNARDWDIIARPNLVVTRETRMPAVIAELGFMTNNSELERMITYEFQEQAAKSLYKSITEALQQIGG